MNQGGRTPTGFRGCPTGPGDDGAVVNGPEITAPEAWDLKGRDMTSFALNDGRVVVVSAHPDDETLAIGGLLQSLRRGGARLEMVVATDGEAAFPSLSLERRAVVGRRRRAEMAEALRELELIDVPVTWLGFPDSALREADLSDALRPILATADMCLAPWSLRSAPRPSGCRSGRPQGCGRWDRGLGLPNLDLALGGPSHHGVALAPGRPAPAGRRRTAPQTGGHLGLRLSAGPRPRGRAADCLPRGLCPFRNWS